MQEHKDKKNLVEQGFTLIELLVVIAILGILAAVVVFSVNGITDRGKTSACKTEASTVQTALEAYDAKNGGYPVATGAVAMSNVLNTPPDKFLNSALDPLTSPTLIAPTAYTYTTSGATSTVSVDGVSKSVVASGTFGGGVC